MKIKTEGHITCRVSHKKHGIKFYKFTNHTLDIGKKFLASGLLERLEKPLYISHILLGDGGTNNGLVKEVNPAMAEMFGVVRLKKKVVSQVDPEFPTRVLFNILVQYDECNDCTLNEMALQLSDDTLFSLATFSDFNKDNEMELMWEWHVIFV